MSFFDDRPPGWSEDVVRAGQGSVTWPDDPDGTTTGPRPDALETTDEAEVAGAAAQAAPTSEDLTGPGDDEERGYRRPQVDSRR